MQENGLSIIIPLYNAEDWVVPTIEHIIDALKDTRFDTEIIIVDDGSIDSGADKVRQIVLPKDISLTIIEQENAGRYLARKTGVNASTKQNILFIDSRVFIDKQSLIFLESQLADNPDQLWNGHVNIDKKGNIFARFWDAIVCVAWRRYFNNPRTTSYTLKEFDYYPKGTGFFYVPKNRLVQAMDHFEDNTSDLRHSSDDTLMIRYLNGKQAIHLSPHFSCLYHGRSTIGTFLSHAYSRGQFFIDGFLRPGTRFFYPLIIVLVLSVILPISIIIYHEQFLLSVLFVLVAFVASLLIGSLMAGVILKDALSLGLLGIPFAIIYLAGLWRGVSRKIISRLRLC